ncbi:hypothetical protein ACO2I3_15365 [Leptospira interrogans]
MTLAQFKALIKTHAPKELSERYIRSATVHALQSADDYTVFKARVNRLFPHAENIFIAGSGNWGYSLNPRKLWEPFRDTSDIDVGVVSSRMFQETWDNIREAHREQWYQIGYSNQQYLRRNGENVYCGFASPLWIPIAGHPYSYAFRRAANTLTSHQLAWREVRLMIFRNAIEAVDYYQRGFRVAQRDLQ